MDAPSGLIDRYVAVWNEPDPDNRRRRIADVWAPFGTTSHRLLEARGYEAIEARVAGSWDRWLREGKYIFQPVNALCHHDAVKFDFAMIATGDGRVEAKGLCYLLLDIDGRVVHDYQFNPSAHDAGDLARQYLASWYDEDARRRRDRIAALWAGDGSLFAEDVRADGLAEISDTAARALSHLTAAGLSAAPAHLSQHHHNVAQLGWAVVRNETCAPVGRSSALLVFDGGGRISTAYHFYLPMAA